LLASLEKHENYVLLLTQFETLSKAFAHLIKGAIDFALIKHSDDSQADLTFIILDLIKVRCIDVYIRAL
jgi:hypothetical protein